MIETQRDRRFAARYDAMMARADDAFLGAARAELVGGLAGTVVEVGAGTGRNLAHYDLDAVDRLLLLEPAPSMRDHLAPALRGLAGARRARVTVLDGDAAAIPLPDDSADAVVCSLVLCSVDDVDAALREVRRVLRPGGQLRFLEHCRATGLRALAQRAVTPVTRRYAGGCRCDRDTRARISAVFGHVGTRRVPAPTAYALLPEHPFLLGTAR